MRVLLVVTATAASVASAAVVTHCGDISSDETWALADEHVLTCQTFVNDGATLTIEAGVTVYAEAVDVGYDASTTSCTPASCTTANKCIYVAADDCIPFTTVLVVLPGGKIVAAGTASAPITFTANQPTEDLPNDGTTVTDSTTGRVVKHGTRGNWGGLIILGKAPVLGTEVGVTAPHAVEGLAEPTAYGGTDPEDDSGVLQYVVAVAVVAVVVVLLLLLLALLALLSLWRVVVVPSPGISVVL
jgi:hypothetical protein